MTAGIVIGILLIGTLLGIGLGWLLLPVKSQPEWQKPQSKTPNLDYLAAEQCYYCGRCQRNFFGRGGVCPFHER